jgi:hypothetical protein
MAHNQVARVLSTENGGAALGCDAWNYWNLGWPDAAIARAEEAVALARSERRMSSR